MKIKTKGIKKKKRNPNAYHWWLVDEKPKKKGRLSSGNKTNKHRKRRTGPSEFRIMAERIDSTRRTGSTR